MTIAGGNFLGGTVVVDGAHYVGCNFKACVLNYKGGIPPSFVNCEFQGVSFSFTGAAGNTLLFMKSLYHGGFQEMINITFKEITDPPAEKKGANE
jgi:hypothetical protein